MMTQESPAIPGVGRKQTNYLLGRGFTESKRLSDQHEVLLKAAGGYIPVPLSTKCEMLEAILDVGTGNGAWLLGLRQSGIIPPSVELYGVDISDKMMPSKELVRKLGINLQVKDLCEPLPSIWNEKFDYIHGRHVFIWIEPYKWLDVMRNLKRTLKPGGTIVVSCDDSCRWTADQDSIDH
jgi:SAM-dependent methyltransferase